MVHSSVVRSQMTRRPGRRMGVEGKGREGEGKENPSTFFFLSPLSWSAWDPLSNIDPFPSHHPPWEAGSAHGPPSPLSPFRHKHTLIRKGYDVPGTSILGVGWMIHEISVPSRLDGTPAMCCCPRCGCESGFGRPHNRNLPGVSSIRRPQKNKRSHL